MAKRQYEATGDLKRFSYLRDDAVRFETEQNVDGLVEYCKEARERVTSTHNRDMVPVAEIPMAVYERAVREGWADDKQAWRKWLSDPDNKVFRVWTGRHR